MNNIDQDPIENQEPLDTKEKEENQDLEDQLLTGDSEVYVDNRRQFRNIDQVVGPLLKKNLIETFVTLVFIAYITLCNYLPEMTGKERNPKCLAAQTMSDFVNYYAWIVMGTYCGVKLIWYFAIKFCYKEDQYLDPAVRMCVMLSFLAIIFVFLMIATPVWFYWSMIIWPKFDSSECFQGFLILDFINLIVIYLAAALFACLASCTVPFCIICCPCITVWFKKTYQATVIQMQEERDNELVRSEIQQGALAKLFNPKMHMAQTSCPICMDDFKGKDFVTTLPCNNMHFFHTACIADWVDKGQNICPLCRTQITRAGIDKINHENKEKK